MEGQYSTLDLGETEKEKMEVEKSDSRKEKCQALVNTIMKCVLHKRLRAFD
jgi:hypothetical protein